MSPRPPFRRDAVSEDAEPVRVNREGTGISMTFKTAVACIVGLIGIIIPGTVWCVNTTNIANKHTETLAEHTQSLRELKIETRELNSKVDQVLLLYGIKPNQLARDTAIKGQ